MKRLYSLLFFLLPICLFSQPLHHLLKESHQTLVFKVNAETAENYIQKNTFHVETFLDQQPYCIFRNGYENPDSLPTGFYIMLSVKDTMIEVKMVNSTRLVVYTINDKHRVQLRVRDQEGNYSSNAAVLMNNHYCKYDRDAQSFIFSRHLSDESFVKVYVPGDTTFINLSEIDDGLSTSAAWKQRWEMVKKTGIYKTITWLPRRMQSLFTKRRSNDYRLPGTHGLLVFNQPKYRINDTVRLKAYLYDSKNRLYQKPADLFLEYYKPGKGSVSQKLVTISPSASGSFIYQFVLRDTLVNDSYYTVIFKNKDSKRLLQRNFKVEDYVLDEIGTYTFKSSKETYYRNDSIQLFAAAKDANGMNLLDASVKLYLLNKHVQQFFRDSLYVSDTLFYREMKLDTRQDTKFSIPVSQLPKANLDMQAKMYFINSNNEIQEKDLNIYYKYHERSIQLIQQNDSVLVTATEDGIDLPAKGLLTLSGSFDKEIPISLPYKIKVDPFISTYEFYWKINDTIVATESLDVNSYYHVQMNQDYLHDTIGFILSNPYQIPVNFSVFKNNQLIARGTGDGSSIGWHRKISNRHQLYTVKWQYLWAGKEHNFTDHIGLTYKLLDIAVQSAKTVFPGQKDNIEIAIKDYDGKPAAGVNLTALSYNSQFKNAGSVPDPPYLQMYHSGGQILYPSFEKENDKVLFKSKTLLGKTSGYINKFGLDTMLYYQILFPAEKIKDIPTHIVNFTPQVSVHVVKDGVPQQVYLLYLNNKLVYYYQAGGEYPYSFEVMPTYSKIGVRLYDKFIEIDSIYTQPNYKHDLILDMDKLPENVVVTPEDNYLSGFEKNLLENSLFQIDAHDSSWIWHNNSVVSFGRSQYYQAGPFSYGYSLHYFAKGNFDIQFYFEPGYRYRLSDKILRLEKSRIFPEKSRHYLMPNKDFSLMLGDTICPPPVISYHAVNTTLKKLVTDSYYSIYQIQAKQHGNLQLSLLHDTTIATIVLKPLTNSLQPVIRNYMPNIYTIPPGNYQLLLVMKDLSVAVLDSIEIKSWSTLCKKVGLLRFIDHDPYLDDLIDHVSPVPAPQKDNTIPLNDERPLPAYAVGTGHISGIVKDAKGNLPISFASIMIKGTRNAVSTNSDGSFSISNIKGGIYTLVIHSIGYESKEIQVLVNENQVSQLLVKLNASIQSLEEVVVVGYGSMPKKDLTGSITSVNGKSFFSDITMDAQLHGKVAGVQVSNADDGAPVSSLSVMLRGVASVNNSNSPVYVIDGIYYNQLPPNITPDMIANMEVLDPAAALALYGAQGSYGAVVITTHAKTIRQQFRDYAFWIPELITNRDGKAAFSITYPDNITGWQSYILAMDKKLRIGKTGFFTQSYKKLMAQLSVPRFLVEGDSALLIGKALNYSNEPYKISSVFKMQGKDFYFENDSLFPQASLIREAAVRPVLTDTLKIQFGLHTQTGFSDAEERTIPVVKKGIDEQAGRFILADHDSTWTFSTLPGYGNLQLTATNKTLDLLINDIKNLKDYPYACNEQSASKLTGLLLEKKIRKELNQPFKDEKLIKPLLERLQKAQQYSGGWGWWEQTNPDFYITGYVIRSLLPLRSDPLIETNIRNGLLFLQNELYNIKDKDVLLTTLQTMVAAGHTINYAPYLQKINWDSLTVQQQWQWVYIQQQLKGDYQNRLTSLIAAKRGSITGAVYWGKETYSWHNNTVATTVLAYTVLKNESLYRDLLPHIVQYFFEMKQSGFWRNTVEAASVLATILPDVLVQHKNFAQPSTVIISGDTSCRIINFPTILHFSDRVKNLQIQTLGGGLTYMSLFQQRFNPSPQPVSDPFSINSYFVQDHGQQEYIRSGQKVKMVVDLEVKNDAEYVMIQVPIPAGCNYASKEQNDWKMHKEFYKEKVVLFAEKLAAGKYSWDIELEPRYNGRYTLNPCKAELMYFPVFYGRNAIKTVDIMGQK